VWLDEVERMSCKEVGWGAWIRTRDGGIKIRKNDEKFLSRILQNNVKTAPKSSMG
jgi:hypothetical protein